jgi:hypothetical protein
MLSESIYSFLYWNHLLIESLYYSSINFLGPSSLSLNIEKGVVFLICKYSLIFSGYCMTWLMFHLFEFFCTQGCWLQLIQRWNYSIIYPSVLSSRILPQIFKVHYRIHDYCLSSVSIRHLYIYNLNVETTEFFCMTQLDYVLIIPRMYFT